MQARFPQGKTGEKANAEVASRASAEEIQVFKIAQEVLQSTYNQKHALRLVQRQFPPFTPSYSADYRPPIGLAKALPSPTRSSSRSPRLLVGNQPAPFQARLTTSQHTYYSLIMVKILSIQVLAVEPHNPGVPAVAVAAASDLSSFSFYQRSRLVYWLFWPPSSLQREAGR